MNKLKKYYEELSISQPNPSLKIECMPTKARQLSMRRCITIAAIIAMSLSLATIAYAAARHFVDRAVVGTSDTFVVVPNESQTGSFPEGFPLPPASDGTQVEGLIPGSELDISNELMALMNNAFKGNFFYEDGSVVESAGIWLPSHAGWYDADGNSFHFYQIMAFQNKALFDENGNELWWVSWNPFSQSFDVGIANYDLLSSERDGVVCNEHEGMTCSEHVGLFCAGSYEEAAALLGRDFRLPDLQEYIVNLFEMQFQTRLDKDHSFYSVVVVMHHIENSPMDSHYSLIFRVTRDDTSFVPDNPSEIRVTGPIEELYFNGVRVYAISDNGQMIRYIWEHDGLTYDIFARDGISHAEYLRIIASMIQCLQTNR